MKGFVIVLCALGVSGAGGDARAARAVHKGKKGKLVAPRPAPPPGSVTPQAEALGRGVHALWDGDFTLARKTLTPLVTDKNVRNPDYVLYSLAQAELLSGDAAAAVTHFARVAKMKSRFADVAVAREGDAALASGDSVQARKLYEAAVQHASVDIDAAVCRFRIAQIIEAAEVPKSAPVKVAAVAAYRIVYVQYPLHPLAEIARQKMRELDPGSNITVAEHITRAKLMTAGRAWPAAVEELKALGDTGTPEEKIDAEYSLGTTLFRMRHHYDEASEKLLDVWNKLPGEERKAEALFHGSQAQSRADHDDEAIVGYKDVVTRFPHSKNAEASFRGAWLELNRGRYAESIPGLEKTLADYGHSSYNDDARWYLGLARWFTGDTEGALADFTKLAAMKGELTGGKGAYWRGRALDKLGRTDEATKVYKALALERPFTYYAMLARVRLNERQVKLDPFGREAKPDDAALAQADATPPGQLDSTVTHDPIVLRADELLAANLPVEAGVELQRGEGELMRHYPGRAMSVLFDRYARGEDFYRMHRLAESYAGRTLDRDPAEPSVRAWWELVYPRAYRAYVEKYAPSGKNPPEYLYTIMLKESAYNPHDVSYADAIGLLQMIPPTSRKVAAHVGVPYTDDVLYDPEGNIRFGAWYIGHLLQKFKGQIAIGAGSFNAGPAAMMKWVDKYGTHPLDEFIELNPYTQTREYMKKALGIYARYAWLYDKEDYLPTLTIDADYVKDDGVDY